MEYENYRSLAPVIWAEYFTYCKDTGLIFNRYGRSVGSVTVKGYLQINAVLPHNGKLVNCAIRNHQLAWLLVTGEYADEIDHKDRDKQNNKWDNLRKATPTLNNNNRNVFAKSKSGLTGVIWNKQKRQWQAYIIKAGVNHHLGFYSNLFEAVCARKSAEVSL